MKPTIDREYITPKLAAEYLAANTTNRPLVPKRINTLVKAILDGEWVENGESIKFNGDGTLIDGQHRLAAIVKAKKGVHSLVVRGVATEAQETIDIGASRTVGNMLALRGIPNANNQAAVAKLIWCYDRSGELLNYLSHERLDASPQQLIAVVENTPELSDWVNFGKRFAMADRSLQLTASVVSAFGLVTSRIAPQEEVEAFFAQILTPRHDNDPTAALRKRLLASSPIHNPMPTKVKTALLIKAWNQWVLGEKGRRVMWRAGGYNAEEFPKILGMDAGE